MNKFLFYLLFVTTYFQAAGQETFSKRFHFDRPAAVCNCLNVTDTAFYAVGITNDTVPPFIAGNFFAKFDLNGNVDFVKILVDTSRTLEVWKSQLLSTNDGGFATAGYSFSQSMNAIVFKYNQLGDTVFTSSYKNLFYPEEEFISPYSFLTTLDDGFLIIEWFRNPDGVGNSEIGLSKMDSEGQLEWRQFYPDELLDQPKSLIIDNDGNYLIGAWNSNISSQNTVFNSHSRIVKVNPNGDLLEDFRTPVEWGLIGPADGLIATSDGGLIVASTKGVEIDLPSFNEIYWQPYIYKLNIDKDLVWGTEIRTSYINPFNFFNRIIELEDGSGYVAAGQIYEPLNIENENGGSGHIAKVSTSGDSLWHRLYHIVDNQTNRHVFNDIKQTADGGFLLCGETTGYIIPDEEDYPHQRGWLMKLDEHGCLVPGCHLIDQVEEVVDQKTVVIYPNPVTDFLNIYVGSMNLTKKLRFELTSLNGRLVKSFDSQESNITHLLPIYDLSAGMYLLNVYDNEKLKFSEKVVIVK